MQEWKSSSGINGLRDYVHCMYRNDPKFSDRYAWANSVDPDQTARSV